MERIRIGLVGAGANTRDRHIPGFLNVEGVVLVSVCNRSIESSKKVADQFGIPKVYDNWTELVGADDTDAICIGTWPYLHCPMTLAVLEANKHVLTEARMALNIDEARSMLDASRTKPNLVAQIVPAPFTLKFDDDMFEIGSPLNKWDETRLRVYIFVKNLKENIKIKKIKYSFIRRIAKVIK